MYPSVKYVVPNEDYVLSITFDNGECGILNLKQYLNFGGFQRLKDYNVFIKSSSRLIIYLSIENREAS